LRQSLQSAAHDRRVARSACHPREYGASSLSHRQRRVRHADERLLDIAGPAPERTNVRALLFDTFGTVVDWRGGLIASMESWGAFHRVEADWPGLADAWRGAYVPSMAKVRSGERDWADLDVLQRESIEILAAKFGAVGLDDAAFDALTRMWHELPPWPDSVEALERLRAKFVIAPLSNGHVALLVRLAKTAGITWDAVFGADVFRHYKPDPETYLGAT